MSQPAAAVDAGVPPHVPPHVPPNLPPHLPPHLDAIMRIPVAVQVFLGSASMPIADLMKLGRGAVVALDHDIADPVDVVVNVRVIARGELVALDDDPSKIGVKLTEIVGKPDPI